MLELIVQSTLVLLLAAAAAFGLRRRSAAMVHRLWMAGLASALAVPALALLTPSIDIDMLPSLFARGVWSRIGSVLPVVWLAGAIVGLAIMLVGTVRLGWFVIGSEPLVDPRWSEIMMDLRRQIAVRRPVQLLHHPRVRFVGTWGLWRPRVIVPAAAREWSDQRVRVVLAHELAHIARGDWPVQVLAEAARAIYWFNPVFWIVAKRLRRESEHAADNVVLELGTDRAGYARELLELSHSLVDAGRDHAPILAVTQPSFLETRLLAVLNPKLDRVAATPWATLVIMLLAFAVTVPLTMLRNGGRAVVPSALTSLPRTDEIIDSAPAADAAVATSDEAEAGVAAEPTARAPVTAAPKSSRQSKAPAGAAAIVNAAVVPGAGNAPATASACPVTPTVTETPTDSPMAASLGNGPWHVNAERTIWVWDQTFTTEKFINAIWIRPQGTQLVISGERIDGEAPPLEARLNCCYSMGFKTGGIRFPVPGCWRVRATAGEHELSFVTEVLQTDRPSRVPD